MWQKIKTGLARFMMGRHGNDQLGTALVFGGLLFVIVSSIIGPSIVGSIISTIGLVAYVWAIFRMFSRNNAARIAENERYLRLLTSIKQFFVRLKNCRTYKYVKCPECKTMLRLPRKKGQINVTCRKCGHQFPAKT